MIEPGDKMIIQQVACENWANCSSSINAITDNTSNHYESWYYKPYVADSLMQVIYQR